MSKLQTLVKAIYSTGFVDGQNYAEDETQDEAFVAKAEQQIRDLVLELIDETEEWDETEDGERFQWLSGHLLRKKVQDL